LTEDAAQIRGGEPSTGFSAAAQAWPSRPAAYFALTVIILATMLNFLDAQVFGMMAQRIKVDFGLTDEQLGFLIGPANVVFYVLVQTFAERLLGKPAPEGYAAACMRLRATEADRTPPPLPAPGGAGTAPGGARQ